jgi:putative transposase
MNKNSESQLFLYRFEAVARIQVLLDLGKSLAEALEIVSRTLPPPPAGSRPPAPSTLERWFYANRAAGTQSLKPKRRKDQGTFRALDPQTVLQEIKAILKHREESLPQKVRRRNVRLIHASELRELLIERGKLKPSCSLSTLYRLLRLNDISLRACGGSRERRRWEAPEPNHTWQADGLRGPYVIWRGRKHPTVIIAIIDDHSRFIVGCDLFLGERAAFFLELFTEALLRYGVPKRLYVDNGGAFCAKEVKELCARLEILHIAGEPYNAPGRGKIERWHQNVKEKWLPEVYRKGLRTMKAARESLQRFVETYNKTFHRSLGTTPLGRWSKDSWRFRSVEHFGKPLWIFGRRLKRRVDRTGCVQVEGKLYEVSQALRGKWVTVLYWHREPEQIEVYLGEEFFCSGRRIK